MGSFLEIKQKVVERCGDYSLVTDLVSYGNNGIEHLINKAVHYLDRQTNHLFNTPFAYFRLAADQVLVHMQGVRSIAAIDILEPGGTTYAPLYFSQTFEQVQHYLETTDVSRGTPYCWTYLTANVVPWLVAFDPLNFEGSQYVLHPTDYTKNTILIAPKADKLYTLRARGRFFTQKLVDDADTSHWLENEEDAVVALTMMYWALDHDNKTLADRYLAEAAVEEIMKDGIEQEEGEGPVEIV